jgi:prepilin-type N-terminal cleavage/methylation domain-containing protein/prepilin-type processing-associated H-X9-DG protein
MVHLLQMRRRHRRLPGFTLVELLVVIAIIGVMVGLLLPAVQAAREAARRMSCSNNLKQIGLAMHNYEGSYKSMPPAAAVADPRLSQPSGEDDDGFGWLVNMLPFIEQQTLYERLSPNGHYGVLGNQTIRNQFAHWPGVAAGGVLPGGDTIVSTYRCPSSALPDFVPATWQIPGSAAVGAGSIPGAYPMAIGYATTDYKGAGGSCQGDWGVLHKLWEAPPTKFKDVIDGLTNTIMAGESSYVTSNVSAASRATVAPTSFQDWPTWIGCFGSGQDETVRINGRTNSPINAKASPSRMYLAVNDDNAFSYHPGGAQFSFCDGSVHFLSDSIDIQTYCHMHDKRDGQVLGSFTQ